MIIHQVLFFNLCVYRAQMKVKWNREFEIIIKWSFHGYYSSTHVLTKHGWKWNEIENVTWQLNDHSAGSVLGLIEWQNTDKSEMKYWMWNRI